MRPASGMFYRISFSTVQGNFFFGCYRPTNYSRRDEWPTESARRICWKGSMGIRDIAEGPDGLIYSRLRIATAVADRRRMMIGF